MYECVRLPVWLTAWCGECFPCSRPPESGQNANSQTPHESLTYNKHKFSQTKGCRCTQSYLLATGQHLTWDAKTESVLSSCWTKPSLAGKWWGHSLDRTRTSGPGPAGLSTGAVRHHCEQRKYSTNAVKTRNLKCVMLNRHEHKYVCTWASWGIW